MKAIYWLIFLSTLGATLNAAEFRLRKKWYHESFLAFRQAGDDAAAISQLMWRFADDIERNYDARDGYCGTPMEACVVGEDQWADDPTKYFNDEERRQAEIVVTPAGTLAFANTGEKLRPDVFYVFVMDRRGSLYVIEKWVGNRNWREQHSTPLAGAPVGYAGYVIVDGQGFITYLSNKSGHYQPAPYAVAQVIHQLDRRGANFSRTKIDVELRGYGNGDYFATGPLPLEPRRELSLDPKLTDLSHCAYQVGTR